MENLMGAILIFTSLVMVFVVVIFAGWIIYKTPETDNLQARKIRFAAATFTGILFLFIFVACLYYVGNENAGKEIFDKGVTAMFTLAGSIVGYLFGQGGRTGGSDSQNPISSISDGNAKNDPAIDRAI